MSPTNHFRKTTPLYLPPIFSLLLQRWRRKVAKKANYSCLAQPVFAPQCPKSKKCSNCPPSPLCPVPLLHIDGEVRLLPDEELLAEGQRLFVGRCALGNLLGELSGALIISLVVIVLVIVTAVCCWCSFWCKRRRVRTAQCAVCRGTSGGSPRSVSSGSSCRPSGRRAKTPSDTNTVCHLRLGIRHTPLCRRPAFVAATVADRPAVCRRVEETLFPRVSSAALLCSLCRRCTVSSGVPADCLVCFWGLFWAVMEIVTGCESVAADLILTWGGKASRAKLNFEEQGGVKLTEFECYSYVIECAMHIRTGACSCYGTH